jgi:hypothetical protein
MIPATRPGYGRINGSADKWCPQVLSSQGSLRRRRGRRRVLCRRVTGALGGMAAACCGGAGDRGNGEHRGWPGRRAALALDAGEPAESD